jgi:hypothetical protein
MLGRKPPKHIHAGLLRFHDALLQDCVWGSVEDREEYEAHLRLLGQVPFVKGSRT